MTDFINKHEILNMLDAAKTVSGKEIDKILDCAEGMEGLTPEDIAKLLMVTDEKRTQRIFSIANKIKEHIYGNRVVMFAPLYISDYCVNQCAYCGFSCLNNQKRRRLTLEQIEEEVKILEKMGHKRLALEAGEDPVNCDMDYILDAIKAIYKVKLKSGEIRRVNVNIAATDTEAYRRLKEAGIGTYILFQETYDRDVYESVHLGGPKRDFEYHLTAFDRAMEAGIDDVGGGVLFGLNQNFRFEVLSLMLHNKHLEDTFNVGFHTISMPRLKSAHGSDMSIFHPLSDEDFLRIVAIIRIAVPFTGIIISTRESPEMRSKLIKAGVSQMSGGSSVDVGGYTNRDKQIRQFDTADERSNDDILRWIIEEGMIPSFCTACYRSGRTGDRFMELAKTGNIKNVCTPNALLTLYEYSLDYGNESLRKMSEDVIDKNISAIGNEKVKGFVIDALKKMRKGERDFYL